MSILPSKKIHYIDSHGVLVEALPTAQLFHRSNARKRLIRGPFGSGKSVIMAQEIFRRASRQAPNADGIRRTRWAIVRNTYPVLLDTTIKTWLDWFPEEKYGNMRHAPPPSHLLKWDVEDRHGIVTQVECEIIFRALDKAAQVRNLLSLEVTGAWFNEAREIPKSIFDAMDSRIGRFPSKRDGGCTWCGIIMDTNPYDTDHWLYDLFEKQSLPGHEFWIQPGEENAANLPTDYYKNISIGKDPEWVRIYVEGKLGFICEGRLVYPSFSHEAHVSSESLTPYPDLPVYVGIDFGLTPSMVWTQVDPMGRWLILQEEVVDSMGIDHFGDICLQTQHRRFPKNKDFRYYADPAGTQRAQTDEKTCYQILATKGIQCEPGAVDFTSRRESIETQLMRMVGGKPAFLIDKTNCPVLVKGFLGGYHYSEISNTGKYRDRPEKNQYSHPHDALQYIGTRLFSINRPHVQSRRKAPNWKIV